MNNLDKKRFVKNFENKGYILIKNFYNKITARKIKINLKNFLEKNKLNLKGVNLINKKSKINSAHNLQKWQLLKKIQKDNKIKTIAKILLKGKVKNFGAEVFAKPAKIGLSSPTHQDNFYWNVSNNKGITFWIALNKSNKKNGSIFYYEKSHKLGLVQHVPSFAPGSSQKINNVNRFKKFKKVYPNLKVGDVLIHHCLIAHGSEKNKSKKDRMGLTLRFIGADSKIDQRKKKKYEKSLYKQKKILN
tara:strand:- start:341 stop:1078 length:738 start_codon:yes stop_codon:yes gene_type:complete